MKEETKKNLLPVFWLLGVVAFLTICIYLLAHSIIKQRTCEWANIDNIEIHAKLNIPDIIDVDCNYDRAQNTKRARFDLDTTRTNPTGHLLSYKFKKMKTGQEVPLTEFLNDKKNAEGLKDTANLYYNSGFWNGENWQTLLNRRTGRLWVTIKYKD